jgi:hypothetical protein
VWLLLMRRSGFDPDNIAKRLVCEKKWCRSGFDPDGIAQLVVQAINNGVGRDSIPTDCSNLKVNKKEKMDTVENAKVKAGDFCLVDTEGKQVHLSDFAGKKPVVLVFNRGFA